MHNSLSFNRVFYKIRLRSEDINIKIPFFDNISDINAIRILWDPVFYDTIKPINAEGGERYAFNSRQDAYEYIADDFSFSALKKR